MQQLQTERSWNSIHVPTYYTLCTTHFSLCLCLLVIMGTVYNLYTPLCTDHNKHCDYLCMYIAILLTWAHSRGWLGTLCLVGQTLPVWKCMPQHSLYCSQTSRASQHSAAPEGREGEGPGALNKVKLVHEAWKTFPRVRNLSKTTLFLSNEDIPKETRVLHYIHGTDFLTQWFYCSDQCTHTLNDIHL